MAERPPLEAVLFDAGGTLVRLDFEWMAETVRSLGLHATTVEGFRRAEVEGRRRYDSSRGGRSPAGETAPLGSTGDVNAYFGAMVETLGGDAATVDAAFDRFRARHLECGLWTRPMEGARDAIDALDRLGLELAVVSNSDGRAESHLRDCGVLEGLSFVIDSDVVGVEKPDPRIFAIALERLGIEPSRTLFVGDILSVDQRGASQAGTHFVLIDPYGDYAPPGVPSIATIAELPEWVGSRFTISGARPGARSERKGGAS